VRVDGGMNGRAERQVLWYTKQNMTAKSNSGSRAVKYTSEFTGPEFNTRYSLNSVNKYMVSINMEDGGHDRLDNISIHIKIFQSIMLN
jgi:hypothetical protein